MNLFITVTDAADDCRMATDLDWLQGLYEEPSETADGAKIVKIAIQRDIDAPVKLYTVKETYLQVVTAIKNARNNY